MPNAVRDRVELRTFCPDDRTWKPTSHFRNQDNEQGPWSQPGATAQGSRRFGSNCARSLRLEDHSVTEMALSDCLCGANTSLVGSHEGGHLCSTYAGRAHPICLPPQPRSRGARAARLES